MPTITTTDTAATPAAATAAPKPPWRFAAERRLGRRARALHGRAHEQLAAALAVVGAEAALAACRHERWALTCLGQAADCDEGSPAQDAWVVLAACRPTLVRRAIHGAPPNRHDPNRRAPGAPGRDELVEG